MFYAFVPLSTFTWTGTISLTIPRISLKVEAEVWNRTGNAFKFNLTCEYVVEEGGA
jgi:hypothetical protein